MEKRYILAHDLGTSGNKACLFDDQGSLLGSVYETYKTYYDQPGYAEHNPEDWWAAVKTTTKKVIAESGVNASQIAAVSFSAHSLGCIPVDKDGRLLRKRVMIWMDSRSSKQAQQILSQYGADKHYQTTGNSFDVSLYPIAKIMWLKENEKEVYDKTFKFIGTKEYIIFKLTGKLGINDFSEAGQSGMLNLYSHDYEADLLRIAGISRDKLCDPQVNTHIVGNVLPNLEQETGLTPKTAVVMGTMDNMSSATGAGCMNQGVFVTNMGTAAWIGVNSAKPLMSPDFKSNVFYVGNGVYHTSMHSHTAAVVFDWVLDNMLKVYNRDYAQIDKIARDAGVGADKLFFLPSFQSGNTIFSSVNISGSLLGLRLHHNMGHIARASMEGIGFDLMMGVDFYKSMGLKPANIRMIGGGAKSGLWREITANMLDAAIEVPKNMQHIGALGAAAIAGVATGIFGDFSIVDKLVVTSNTIQPDKAITEKYSKLLPVYKKCYQSIMPVYDALAEI
jgi:sugar (pentulose or hexulose) kinase